MSVHPLRHHIVPSPAELAEDLKWCTKAADAAVYAKHDIPPFTRVAVCPGRVYTDEEHARIFGDTDAWGQWTVVRQSDGSVKKGFVVTPGLPGGALDPLYDNPKVYGLAPFFADTQPGVEPVCIYVINARKGRMEYWTGRNGALKNEKLTLCYDEEARCPKFPTVYVLYGPSLRPRSVLELAHDKTGVTPYSVLRKYADYDVANPGDASVIRGWANAYNPHLPTKLPRINSSMNNQYFEGNHHIGIDTDYPLARERFHQYRSNLYNALHTMNVQMRNTQVMPVSQKARRAYNFIATKYLGKLIRRGCRLRKWVGLSGYEALKLTEQLARWYGYSPLGEPGHLRDDLERLLYFAKDLSYMGHGYILKKKVKDRDTADKKLVKYMSDVIGQHQQGLVKYMPELANQDVVKSFKQTYPTKSKRWDVALAQIIAETFCKRVAKWKGSEFRV